MLCQRLRKKRRYWVSGVRRNLEAAYICLSATSRSGFHHGAAEVNDTAHSLPQSHERSTADQRRCVYESPADTTRTTPFWDDADLPLSRGKGNSQEHGPRGKVARARYRSREMAPDEEIHFDPRPFTPFFPNMQFKQLALAVTLAFALVGYLGISRAQGTNFLLPPHSLPCTPGKAKS